MKVPSVALLSLSILFGCVSVASAADIGGRVHVFDDQSLSDEYIGFSTGVDSTTSSSEQHADIVNFSGTITLRPFAVKTKRLFGQFGGFIRGHHLNFSDESTGKRDGTAVVGFSMFIGDLNGLNTPGKSLFSMETSLGLGAAYVAGTKKVQNSPDMDLDGAGLRLDFENTFRTSLFACVEVDQEGRLYGKQLTTTKGWLPSTELNLRVFALGSPAQYVITATQWIYKNSWNWDNAYIQWSPGFAVRHRVIEEDTQFIGKLRFLVNRVANLQFSGGANSSKGEYLGVNFVFTFGASNDEQ